MNRTLSFILLAGALILMACTLLRNNGTAQARSALSLENDRENPVRVTKGSGLERALVLWDFFFNKPAGTRPAGEIPVQRLTRQALLAAPDNTVYRLGHSTVLLKLNGTYWLTDPVFSERSSPVQFAGPQRFHAPPIKAVIISHDHYDHLDHASIMKLADKTDWFLTPLGVGDILVGWGVPPAQVRQLDWWQETEIDGVGLAATPAQHFSGRGPFEKNPTQWASWAILADGRRVFFSGDSGYFGGFRQIGEKYGPFDLTLLEAGAYNENWPTVHMHPAETIQAHLDLKGKRLLPIHNGTFDLSMHSWQEPFDRISALGTAHGIPVLTPMMGEPASINDSNRVWRWWEGVDRTQQAGQGLEMGQPGGAGKG